MTPIRSTKVLNSARGQPCAMRLPGICNGNPETTVWCHLNGGAFGKGMGQKAHDILGFHGCSDCHRYLDTGHGTRPLVSNDVLLECLLNAVCETYVRLVNAGIVVVPIDTPKPFNDRPVAKRKPPAERTKIPHGETKWGSRKIPSRPIQRKGERA